MDILEYFDAYPTVPPMPRGGQKFHLNFNVTPDEYDIVQQVVHHPATRDHFNVEVQMFLRWLLRAFASDFAQRVADSKPVFNRLFEASRLESRRFVASKIDEFLNERAYELHLLLTQGLVAESLVLFKDVLIQMRQEPYPWNDVFETMFFRNDGIDRYRRDFRILDSGKLVEIEKYAGKE